MRRSYILPAVLTILSALLAAGWIFQTKQTADSIYEGTVAGDATVSVRFETGTAVDAAERAAESYRSAGWEEIPVSTRTFRLFARGRRTAALLTEDTAQGGARVTEFRRGNEL